MEHSTATVECYQVLRNEWCHFIITFTVFLQVTTDKAKAGAILRPQLLAGSISWNCNTVLDALCHVL